MIKILFQFNQHELLCRGKRVNHSGFLHDSKADKRLNSFPDTIFKNLTLEVV